MLFISIQINQEVYLSNVHVWEVGEKVVANKEAHQHPVINDPLKVIIKW